MAERTRNTTLQGLLLVAAALVVGGAMGLFVIPVRKPTIQPVADVIAPNSTPRYAVKQEPPPAPSPEEPVQLSSWSPDPPGSSVYAICGEGRRGTEVHRQLVLVAPSSRRQSDAPSEAEWRSAGCDKGAYHVSAEAYEDAIKFNEEVRRDAVARGEPDRPDPSNSLLKLQAELARQRP